MKHNVHESLLQYLTPIDELVLDPRNARKHPDDNLKDIEESLLAFGQDQLIVFRTATREIIKGNGRWRVMKDIGWTHCAAIGVDDDALKARARAVADNRSGETSAWDDEILAATFEELKDTDWIDDLGFSPDEIQEIVAEFGGQDKDEEDAREPVDDARAGEAQEKWGTALGQLWRIGKHFMMIGDSTNPQVVANTMQGKQFTMAFTDPPYGVSWSNEAGTRKTKFKSTAGDEAGGELNLDVLCQRMVSNLARFGAEAWSAYVCFGDSYIRVLERTCKSMHVPFDDVPIVWVKNHFSILGKTKQSQRYHAQHEHIWYLGPGIKADKAWNGPANETTTWEISRTSKAERVGHPTQKPVELAERAIKNSSKVGDVVVDLFAGSGSTLVAAHLQGRIGYMVEIDPGYAALTLERMAPLVNSDIERVEEIREYDVPAGPEVWKPMMFYVSESQEAIITEALRRISSGLDGKNVSGRALEFLAAEYLGGSGS